MNQLSFYQYCSKFASTITLCLKSPNRTSLGEERIFKVLNAYFSFFSFSYMRKELGKLEKNIYIWEICHHSIDHKIAKKLSNTYCPVNLKFQDLAA